MGLDTGVHAALKAKLDDGSAANRLGIYQAVVDAAPALAKVSASGPRDAIFRATLLWLAQAARPFASFPYGAVSVDSYPVPYVVSQVEGAYQALPDFLATEHTIDTHDDAEAYLDRLNAFGPAMDQQTEVMRADAAAGAAPPGFLLDATLTQLRQFQNDQNGPGAGLVASLARRTAAKGIAGDWATRAQAIVDGQIATAAQKQIALLTSLRTGARDTAGVQALPGGDIYYAACLRLHTTTDHSPQDVHRMGLDEAERV